MFAEQSVRAIPTFSSFCTRSRPDQCRQRPASCSASSFPRHHSPPHRSLQCCWEKKAFEQSGASQDAWQSSSYSRASTIWFISSLSCLMARATLCPSFLASWMMSLISFQSSWLATALLTMKMALSTFEATTSNVEIWIANGGSYYDDDDDDKFPAPYLHNQQVPGLGKRNLSFF